MTNPSEQFLFLPSPAPGIFSSVRSPSSSNHSSGFRENPRKRHSRLIPAGSPLRFEPSNPDSVSTPRRHVNRRPGPDAPKITPPCSECGKKFWSWKALFGHMRCHPERQWRGMNPPVNFQSQQPIVPDPFWGPVLGGRPATTVDGHEAAACLLMLANGQPGEPSQIFHSNHETDGCEGPVETSHCPGAEDADPRHQQPHLLGRFECSGCKEVFGARQVLGGHCASHKNVKGCFASGLMQSSSNGCCENVMDSDNSEASPKTQLALNSAAKESREVDLSLRLGL